MVIDSSALLAILLDEPEKRAFSLLIRASATKLMSSVSYLEAGMVADSRTKGQGSSFDKLIAELGITVETFTPAHAEEARRAWKKYGKRNHAANLNFGDCCSYATARLAMEPLLYKGGDFAQTDIAAAI